MLKFLFHSVALTSVVVAAAHSDVKSNSTATVTGPRKLGGVVHPVTVWVGPPSLLRGNLVVTAIDEAKYIWNMNKHLDAMNADIRKGRIQYKPSDASGWRLDKNKKCIEEMEKTIGVFGKYADQWNRQLSATREEIIKLKTSAPEPEEEFMDDQADALGPDEGLVPMNDVLAPGAQNRVPIGTLAAATLEGVNLGDIVAMGDNGAIREGVATAAPTASGSVFEEMADQADENDEAVENLAPVYARLSMNAENDLLGLAGGADNDDCPTDSMNAARRRFRDGHRSIRDELRRVRRVLSGKGTEEDRRRLQGVVSEEDWKVLSGEDMAESESPGSSESDVNIEFTDDNIVDSSTETSNLRGTASRQRQLGISFGSGSGFGSFIRFKQRTGFSGNMAQAKSMLSQKIAKMKRVFADARSKFRQNHRMLWGEQGFEKKQKKIEKSIKNVQNKMMKRMPKKVPKLENSIKWWKQQYEKFNGYQRFGGR